MAMIKTWKPVPYFTKGGNKPELIVLHIGEGLKHQILSEFMFGGKVSAHYCVNRDGSVWQFVADEDQAWANGDVVRPTSEIVKAHKGKNPNSFSLSIEHEGYAYLDISTLQYEITAKLVKELCQKWNIPIVRKHIIGHNEVKATKNCPGKINVARIVVEAAKPTATLTPQQKSALVRLLEAFGLNVEKIMKWFS